MKVILLKDVPKIGRKNDIKDVNDGYAINFLIPKKLAELATAKKISEIEEMKQGIIIQNKIHDDLLAKNLASIDGLELIIKGKAGESGSLFKGIRKEDIIEKIKKDYKVELAPEYLILDKPIKEIGEHKIQVSVKNKKASFKVIIEAE